MAFRVFLVTWVVFPTAICHGQAPRLSGSANQRSASASRARASSGPVLHVSLSYPGADADLVDQTVARPVLQQLTPLADGGVAEAESSDGACEVTIHWPRGVYSERPLADVKDQIGRALPLLPDECWKEGVAIRSEADRGADLWLALTTPERPVDVGLLAQFAVTHVPDSLARVAGVRSVNLYGVDEPALWLAVDPHKLAARNLTLADVRAALEGQRVHLAPDGVSGDLGVKVISPDTLKKAKDLEQTVLGNGPGGVAIRLRDVGAVKLGLSKLVFATVDMQPAVLVHVTAERGMTMEEMKKRIEELQSHAPRGINFRAVLDASRQRHVHVEITLPAGNSVERTRHVCERLAQSIKASTRLAALLSFSDKVRSNRAIVLVAVKSEEEVRQNS